MQHACAPLGPRVDSVDCKPLGLPFNISSSLGLHSNKTEKVNMLKACRLEVNMGFKEEIKKISCTLNNTHTASLRS